MNGILASKFALLRAYLEGHVEARPAVIMVTSAHEDDGRSFSALGLAASFHGVGHRTAVLDGEARGVLPKRARLGTSVTATIGTSSIDFEDPEASSFAAIKALIARLRAEYAFVVVDAPPLLRYQSVMVLAGEVDAVLLTVRKGRAVIPQDELAVRMLKLAKANVVGVVAVASENLCEIDEFSTADTRRNLILGAPEGRAEIQAATPRASHMLSRLRRS